MCLRRSQRHRDRCRRRSGPGNSHRARRSCHHKQISQEKTASKSKATADSFPCVLLVADVRSDHLADRLTLSSQATVRKKALEITSNDRLGWAYRRCAAREVDLRDPRVRAQCRARAVTKPGEDIDDAGGQPGLLHDPRKLQHSHLLNTSNLSETTQNSRMWWIAAVCGGYRCQLRRLHHAGVALRTTSNLSRAMSLNHRHRLIACVLTAARQTEIFLDAISSG